MSRELPPAQETSLWRISQELVVLNGLLAAYLKYTAASAKMAAETTGHPELMLQRICSAAELLDASVDETLRG